MNIDENQCKTKKKQWKSMKNVRKSMKVDENQEGSAAWAVASKLQPTSTTCAVNHDWYTTRKPLVQSGRWCCQLCAYVYVSVCRYSLPRLCLEGSYSVCLKGPGSVGRPGRFPQDPPRGSPPCFALLCFAFSFAFAFALVCFALLCFAVRISS